VQAGPYGSAFFCDEIAPQKTLVILTLSLSNGEEPAFVFAFALAFASSRSPPKKKPCHSERSEELRHLFLPLLFP
jgi:hypothetical protein